MIDPNDAETLYPEDFDTPDPTVDDVTSNTVEPQVQRTADTEATFDPNETWDEGP